MENSHIPFTAKVRTAYRSFSLFEKSVVVILAAVFVLSGITFLYLFNESYKVTVPESGGTIREGVIGFPQPENINPLTATSSVDKDIASLVFSGLLRIDSNGNFQPDLAKSYTLSADGLTYDFILRKGATYQDGTPITAEDIIATYEKAGDPKINPTLAAAWQGVTVRKISDSELKITLPKPLASFVENFTLGILPVSYSKTNIVGSGPYRIKNMKSTIAGVPEYYELGAFNEYVSGVPHISNIVIRFYDNGKELLDAYRGNEIDTLSGTSLGTMTLLQNSGSHVVNVPVARSYAVFFNQAQIPALQDAAVRDALNTVIDRGDLVNKVLQGYGTPLYLPVPPTLLTPSATSSALASALEDENGERVTAAMQILHQAGWQQGPDGIMSNGANRLEFSLSVPNVPELVATANYLKQAWSAIGAQVLVKVYTAYTFQANIVDTRNYDSLLFGQQFGHALYLSPFWSSASATSSQNVAMYENANVDAWLQDATTATSTARIQNDYQNVEDQIMADIPAVFLYTPTYPYVIDSDIRGLKFIPIEDPSERFVDVKDWYIETDRVWKIFDK